MADVTTAVSPSTVIVLLAGVAPKPEPLIVTCVPSVQMVGSTLVMLTTTSPRSTVTVAVAVRVPEVAVMVAEPSDTAATKPASETVAIVESDEDQVTVTSASVLPPASSPVAVSVSVSPMTLKVQVSDLKASDEDSVWPGANIERRCTTHVLGSGFLFHDDALPLIKDDTVVIPAGITRQVWLVLNSRGLAPQAYAGTVTVTGGEVHFSIPLTAKVYPIQMPANPIYLAQAWAYFTWPPAKGYEEQAAAEMELAYDNAHVLHHYYIPWPKGDKATKRLVRDADGKIVVDFTRFDEMLTYRPYVKQWLLWTRFEFRYMHLKYTSGATDMPKIEPPSDRAKAEDLAAAANARGATLMIAGNLPGRTQTMSIAIFDAVQTGRTGDAQVLALTLSFVSVGLLVAVGLGAQRRAT